MLLVSLCLLAAACTANGILVRENRTRHEPETFHCFYRDLSTRQAFAAAAQARAKGGDLLLFNVNAYYVPLALRLAGNLARLGERSYLAVGYDAEVCRSLHQHGVCACPRYGYRALRARADLRVMSILPLQAAATPAYCRNTLGWTHGSLGLAAPSPTGARKRRFLR